MGKELTPALIKQLEENANLMKSKGLSDAEIQNMSNQFIEEYGVVKKKEEPKLKTTSSGSTSSNTKSSSVSQSSSVNPYYVDITDKSKSSNTVSKPTFTPIVDKPLFKKDINVKSASEEQKLISAKNKVNTKSGTQNTQPTNYNEIINAGIKGTPMDNTYMPLSKPIVEKQSQTLVKQATEQKKVQQQAKSEKHQNILAIMPELGQAKNKDEALGMMIKSDMKNHVDMWQQFDDNTLLNKSEYELNDFLVSNGFKDKTREQYLKEQAQSNPKYAYEYEYNQIGSLFKAVKQRADDYDYVLKSKFGDNYMQEAKDNNPNILGDEDFNKYLSLREKENSLSTKANGLINDSRFKDVKKQQDDNVLAQQKSDKIAKEDKWYNFSDEWRYLKNKAAYAAGHVVKLVAEIPSIATSEDIGYDFTDKIADWGNRFSENLVNSVPVSSDLQNGFNYEVAKVDGYKVILDGDKNPIKIVDNNNFNVSQQVSDKIFNQYKDNKDNYEIHNEYSPRSLVDNGLNTMIDMGIMILGTKGAGMLGAGVNTAKLVSMGIGYMQTKRDTFNDAIKKGLDPKDADILSNIVGIAAGTSSIINPMEFNIATGNGIMGLIKKVGFDAAKLALIREGKLSVKEYAKEFIKEATKNALKENIEEVGIENTVQALSNNYFNNKISETDKIDGGLDTELHWTDKQGIETLLVTAGTAILLTPLEINSQTKLNQQEALKTAFDNPEQFEQIRKLQLQQGYITQEQYDNERKIYDDVSRVYNASKDEVSEKEQPYLLALLTKKYNLAYKIDSIKDDTVSKKYKDLLGMVNASIDKVMKGEKPDNTIVETDDKTTEQDNTQQNTTYGSATATYNSSISTKIDVEIANKINQHGLESLTNNEKDYYENDKENIDKLIAGIKVNGGNKNTTQTNTGSDNLVNTESNVQTTNDNNTSQSEQTKFDNTISETTNTQNTPLTNEDKKSIISNLDKVQIKEFMALKTNTERNQYLLNVRQNEQSNKSTSTASANTESGQDNGTTVQTASTNDTGLGAGNEQSVPTNTKEIQQNDKGLQEKIDNLKNVISELENSPNSPFHKLVNLDEQKAKLAELEKQLNSKTTISEQITETTPNVEDKKADIERRKQALRDLMQTTGDETFILGTEDGTFAGDGLLNMNENGDVVLTRFTDSEENLTKGKGKTENLANIAGQFGGEQIATSGVEGGLQSFTNGVIGEYHIPLQDLINLIKEGYVVFAGLGNKEFVLSPHIADKYLSSINGKKINAKYDAEYVDAVKKGEMTKEQAMKALEEVGRRNSKAYAELDALEGAKPAETTPISDKKADIERRKQEDTSVERGVLINYESGKTKEQLLDIVDKLKSGNITYDEVVKEFFNLPTNTLEEIKKYFNDGTLSDKIQFGLDVKEISDSTPKKKNKEEILKQKQIALSEKQKAEDALKNSEFKIVKKKDTITGQITETKIKRNVEEKTKYEDFYKQQINVANEQIKKADAELKSLENTKEKLISIQQKPTKQVEYSVGYNPQETETTPNVEDKQQAIGGDWSKDVESTAKALEGVKFNANVEQRTQNGITKYDANESEAEALKRLTQGISELPKEQQTAEIEKRAKEHAIAYEQYLENNPISQEQKALPRVSKFEEQTAKAMQDIIDNPTKWESKTDKSFENGSRIDENGDAMPENEYISLKEKVKSLRKQGNLDEISKINSHPNEYFKNNLQNSENNTNLEYGKSTTEENRVSETTQTTKDPTDKGILDDLKTLKNKDLSDTEIRDVLDFMGYSKQDIDIALGGKEVFGIKKALVPEQVIENVNIDKLTHKQIFDIGKNNVDNDAINPKQIVDDVLDGNITVLDANQVGSLIYYRAQLANRITELSNKIKEVEPNTGEYNVLKKQYDLALQEQDNYHEMAVRTAYNQSIAFSMRKLLIDDEYTAQKQISIYKQVNNGTISAEKEQEFKELAQKYKEASDRIAELEQEKAKWNAQNEIELTIEKSKKISKQNSDRKKTGRDLVAQGLDELGQLLGGIKFASGDNMPQLTKALSKIGRGLIEIGSATVDDVFDKIKTTIKDKFGDKINLDSLKESVTNEIKSQYTKATVNKKGELSFSMGLIRSLILNGYNTVDTLTNKLKEIAEDQFPDISDRQIHDAITRYGNSENQSKDDIDKEMYKLKRIMLLMSKVEDAQAGKRPLKTGVIRDEATDEERTLQKQLNELLKDIPLDDTENDKRLKTALESVKTRLRNQIKDLETQIEQGKSEAKKKGIEYDDEANGLVELRDALKKELEDKYGKGGMSDEQRLKMSLNQVKKAIDNYEQRINNKDFTQKDKSTTPSSEELTQAKQRLNSLKAEYTRMYKETKEYEAKQLENKKKAVRKRIEELKTKIVNKDFTPAQKKASPFDDELGKLNNEKLRQMSAFQKEQELNRIENRTKLEKAKDAIIGILNIPRMLTTTIDMSAPFRQGIRLMAGHPIEFAKAFIQMHKLAFSQKAYDDFMDKFRSSDAFPIIKASGLSITDVTIIQKAREEQFWNNIISNVLENKTVNKYTFGIPKVADNYTFKASERAYSGFLDMLRINVFMSAVDVMQNNGITIENNKEAYKQLAYYVNSATGRGDMGGVGQDAQSFLNTFFFSAKFMKSLYDYTKSFARASTGIGNELPPEIRKMIVKDFISFFAVNTILVGLGQLAVRALGGDDERKLETDGRSSDFMKIVKGDTRYEFWSGFQPAVRTAIQYATGEQKSVTTGNITELGSNMFTPTRNDKIIDFFGNKLSPIASYAYKWGKGTQFGKPFDAKGEAKKLFIPMNIQNIAEEVSNNVKASKIIIDAILNNYGVSVQNFNNNDKKEVSKDDTKANKHRPNRFKRDKNTVE